MCFYHVLRVAAGVVFCELCLKQPPLPAQQNLLCMTCMAICRVYTQCTGMCCACLVGMPAELPCTLTVFFIGALMCIFARSLLPVASCLLELTKCRCGHRLPPQLIGLHRSICSAICPAVNCCLTVYAQSRWCLQRQVQLGHQHHLTHHPC